MKKHYLSQDVYTATMQRLDYIFNEFENVYVAFSGGKDSGVLLHLCLEYLRSRHDTHKLGVFHMDYECQYQQTTEYVEYIKQAHRDELEFYHVCMPIKAQNCVSMNHGFWRPWDPELRKIWVRDLPRDSLNMDNHHFSFWNDTLTDYDFNLQFAEWFSQQHTGKTICLTGIRTDESLERYLRIMNSVRKYQNVNYIYECKRGTYIGYPIYDWATKDIWLANYKFNFPYNKLYDLYYQANVKIEQMRVASPFNDCASAALKLYKAIDPNTWAKMLSRVNGVSFAGIYGGTTAMGWRSITKPDQFTWQEYLQFLLSTLDAKSRYNYETKFAISIRFWREKGGAISQKTIEQLQASGVEFENMGSISKISTKNVVRFKKYPDDVDVDEFRTVPSFKRMCICILKNDWYCKYMGFTATKAEITQRKAALEKYKNL